jgi:nucleotide-binding universal stress UspA family protein
MFVGAGIAGGISVASSDAMKVLVCTDFSAAAATAEREAAARLPDAVLILFHAVDPCVVRGVADRTGLDRDELRTRFLDFADVRMKEIAERLESRGRHVVNELHEGDPVDAALATAAKHGVALIVVGGVAGDGARFRTGLARRSRWPVLVVPIEG